MNQKRGRQQKEVGIGTLQMYEKNTCNHNEMKSNKLGSKVNNWHWQLTKKSIEMAQISQAGTTILSGQLWHFTEKAHLAAYK